MKFFKIIVKPLLKYLSSNFFLRVVITIILILSLGIRSSLAYDTPKFHILDNQTFPPSPTPKSEPQDLDNLEEFTSFADGFFNQKLSELNIPGAVISVVKDGKVWFTKGYGYSDLEKKTPVDSDRTLFRVASLSKLFTGTAAMQLYEQGKLNLEADVNQYLKDWQLENPYEEAVTPARMMTHTDGTTRRLMGIAAPNHSQMQPLATYLSQYMPSINYPPGKLYSYSNHSIALLGYLVEQISGQDFADYIDKNIFQPLEMSQSTFRQPPLSQLPDNLAKGYQIKNGQAQTVPYLYLNIAPATSLMTTATDMSHFMIAHLQQGRYQDAQILEPKSVELMHQNHFQLHPLIPGTSFSFRERLVNDQRLIGHLGSLRGYSAFLNLMPQHNLGIFIATNSFNNLHGQFINQFCNRYFPRTSNSLPVTLTQLSSQELQKYTGIYWDLEYPRNTFAKILAIAQQIRITINNNGNLLVQNPALFFRNSIGKFELIPTNQANLFYRQSEHTYVYFTENNGKVTHVSNAVYPKIGAFEKISWYENVRLHLVILTLAILFWLSAIIINIRTIWKTPNNKSHYQLAPIRSLSSLIAGLNLSFLITLPLYLWWWGPWKLAYGASPLIMGLLTLPIISTILTVILAGIMLLMWPKTQVSLLGRLHYSLLTLMSLMFIPLLVYWNLLGWHF